MREALLAVLARLVDEHRWGLRLCSIDEMRDLVDLWSSLDDGETPTEAMLRLVARIRS